MKKVLLSLMCLAAMLTAGIGLRAQEVTIRLMPGWNWIAYPYPESVSIETALGDFEPMEGDVIESLFGYSEYFEGYGWFGGIESLKPGWGYMYFSNRTEAVNVVLHEPASQSLVATSMPTDITAVSAVVGGTVTVPEGCHVFLRGVCWDTEPNPDIDGNHTSDGTGIGSFSVTLEGLSVGTTYYVRAYAVTDYGLAYGEELSFITAYEYVDLGLPSGTLWATFNVGANAPEEYGDDFAWGETQSKDSYGWNNYQHCYYDVDWPLLTRYCNKPNLGYNGYSDTLTTLLPEDDAATANWGADWRMPTKEEWEELIENVPFTMTEQNGVFGWLFTSENGNSLFLPAAENFNFGNSVGFYWSSSLDTDHPTCAWCYSFDMGSLGYYFRDRCYGLSVRAVRSASQSTSFVIDATASPIEGGAVIGGGTYEEGAECTLAATANEGYTFTNWTEDGEEVSTEATYSFIVNGNRNLVANFSVSSGDHDYVDLGLPSGLLWATCNVGADAPEDYGDYFAWGETQPKDTYNWSTYQYCNGSYNTLTKYCNNSSYGYNGFTDNLTTLLPEDDAATANWGTEWRMPTYDEWVELYQNTTHTWTTQNGVNGHLFTASNGNSLFLPAADRRNDSSLGYAGSYGYYWSSSLYTDDPYSPWYFYFYSYSGTYDMELSYRYYGHSVRAVRSSAQN